MTSLRYLRRLSLTLLGRSALEAEMDEEMRTHIEMETEELIRSGLDPREARRQAAIAFGGVQQVKEAAIDDRSIEWLENLRRNVRIATRTLWRQKTFTVTAVLALALAIAVNTTLFSVIDAMLNPTIGAKEPERLFEIKYFGDPRTKVDFRARDAAIDSASSIYEGLTAWAWHGNGTAERGTRALQANAKMVLPNFFPVLGVSVELGRSAPGADEGAVAASVVISDRLRHAIFSDGEQVIGAVISYEGKPYTVIGVARSTRSIEALQADLWMFSTNRDRLPARYVRLKRGVTLEQAHSSLALLAERLGIANGDTPKSTSFYLKTVVEQFHASGFHYALIGAGLAILLVACTNLANLQIARGLARSPELALRGALGASRRQLVQQLLIESAVIAAVALALAIFLAIAGNAILRATIPRSVGEYIVEPRSSWRMVAAAAAAAVFCVISIGLVPALRVSMVDLNTLMKSRAGTGTHRGNRRAYGFLVVAQIAVTLPLVTGAVLLSRSAIQMRNDEWVSSRNGFVDPRNLIHVSLKPPQDTTASRVPIAELSFALVERMRHIANVADAGVSYSTGTDGSVTVEEADGATRVERTDFWSHRVVTPAWLRASGMRTERGTDYTDGQHGISGVILDETTAKYLWPRSDALGRHIRFGSATSPLPMLPVVGILHDPRSAERRLQDSLQAFIPVKRLGFALRVMTPFDSVPQQRRGVYLDAVVRARSDPARVVTAIRADLRAWSMAPPSVSLYEDYLGIRQAREGTTFIAGLFTVLAAFALGLSALGIYGIVAQSVTDRQREVAVRISLGATPRNIVHALIRQGNVLLLAGIALGLLFTAMSIQWLGLFLGGAETWNPSFFAATSVFVYAIMILAALVPAMRATHLDPMQVLRAE